MTVRGGSFAVGAFWVVVFTAGLILFSPMYLPLSDFGDEAFPLLGIWLIAPLFYWLQVRAYGSKGVPGMLVLGVMYTFPALAVEAPKIYRDSGLLGLTNVVLVYLVLLWLVVWALNNGAFRPSKTGASPRLFFGYWLAISVLAAIAYAWKVHNYQPIFDLTRRLRD